MGQTFENTISSKTTGTSEVQSHADAIRQLAGSLEGLVNKANDVNKHSGFSEFAAKVKEGIENPLHAIGATAEEALKELGPFGVGIAGIAGVIVASGMAGFEAAKSLAEYGEQIRNVELRTGMSAKTVGQFSFAARAVGQDVSILDRLMRGLTMAVTDNGVEGDKAISWLKRFGVDIGDVRAGTAPTAEVLERIGEGLSKLPTQFERNRAAIDIFKRAGIEALPFLLELAENLATAREQGFGPSEGDIARFLALEREVNIIETKWASFKRDAKEGLVISVSFAGTAAKWLLDHMPGEEVHGGVDESKAGRARGLAADIEAANRMKYGWGGFELTGVQALEKQRIQSLEGLTTDDAWAVVYGGGSSRAKAQIQQAEQLAQQIRAIQQKTVADQKAARDAENQRALAEAGAEADRLRRLYFGGKEALDKAYADAKRDVDKYGQQLLEARENKTPLADVQKIGESLASASRRMNTAKAELDLLKERGEWDKQAADFRKSADESELTAIEKLLYKRDLLLAQAAKLKVSATETNAVVLAADQAIASALQKSMVDFERWNLGTDVTKGQSDAERRKGMFGPNGPLNPLFGVGESVKQWTEAQKADAEILDVRLRSNRSEISAWAERADRMQQFALGPGHEAEAATAGFDTRMRLAKRLYDLDLERAAKEDDIDRRRVDNAKARADLDREGYQAVIELELKIAELERQRVERFRALMVGGFDAMLSGSFSQFLQQQGIGLAERVVGNAAEMSWGAVSRRIPHASQDSTWGKLLAGSEFGPDPMSVAGVRLETAGDRLSIAAGDLMSAARAIATSPSGGGGGIVRAARGYAGGSWDMGGAWDPFAPGENGDFGANSTTIDNSSGFFSEAAPAGGTDWGRVAGIGGAAVTSGIGIYSGLQKGGVQGAMAAAGGMLSGAGAIMALASKALAWAGPAGMIAGLALGFLPSLLGDKRRERDEAESDTLSAARYYAPTPSTYRVDRYGRSYDSDVAGNSRIVVQVQLPVAAWDARDVVERGTMVADSLAEALDAKLTPRLAMALRNTVMPQ